MEFISLDMFDHLFLILVKTIRYNDIANGLKNRKNGRKSEPYYFQDIVGDIASWAEHSIWEGAGDVSKTRMSKREICSREGTAEGLLMLMPARLDWYAAGEMCRSAIKVKMKKGVIQN